MNFKHYLGIAIVFSALTGILLYGKTQYRKGYTDAQNLARQQAADEALRQSERIRLISQTYQRQHAQLQENERTQNAKLDQIIAQNTVYLNRCFDDNGLRELNNAIGGGEN